MTRLGRPILSHVIVVAILGLGLFSDEAVSGLYQCKTDEGTIYTDTPAQLKQCTPLGQSGGASSLGLVGGPTTGRAPAAAPALPQLVMPPMPDAAPALPPPPSAPSGETATPTPCSTGINPLNPLSGPPCSTTEPSPPAASNVPADPNALPPTPAPP